MYICQVGCEKKMRKHKRTKKINYGAMLTSAATAKLWVECCYMYMHLAVHMFHWLKGCALLIKLVWLVAWILSTITSHLGWLRSKNLGTKKLNSAFKWSRKQTETYLQIYLILIKANFHTLGFWVPIYTCTLAVANRSQ